MVRGPMTRIAHSRFTGAVSLFVRPDIIQKFSGKR
jgi:hypothetical protein